MKKTIIFITLLLFLGKVSFADEAVIPKPPNKYYNVGAPAMMGGVVIYWLASDYENKHNDPKKYDQEEVKATADSQRTLGIVFVVGGLLLVMLGAEEDKKEKKTSVSIEQRGDDSLLMAKYRF